MKTILVTGGAGFIGSNFCNINKKKFKVIALDNLFLGTARNLDPEITFIEGDACLISDLNKVLEHTEIVDYVLHLAGTSSAPMFMGDKIVEAYRNSIVSFTAVTEWARKNGAKKIMYASTSSLYGNNEIPLVETQRINTPNHYSVTKCMYEQFSECYNRVYPELEFVGFRFMSVYGPNEEAKGQYANIISQFAWDIARDKTPIIYGDGTQYRDFTNVRDIVQAITKAIEYKEYLGADVFNVGTGATCSLNEIMNALNKAFKTNVKPKYIKNPVKEGYIQGQCANITKITKVLGFKPTVKLENGIQEQVDNLKMDLIKETSSDLIRD